MNTQVMTAEAEETVLAVLKSHTNKERAYRYKSTPSVVQVGNIQVVMVICHSRWSLVQSKV